MNPYNIVRFDHDGPVTNTTHVFTQFTSAQHLLAGKLRPVEEIEFAVATYRDPEHESIIVLTDLRVLAVNVPHNAFVMRFAGVRNTCTIQDVYLLDIVDMTIDESTGQGTISRKNSGSSVSFPVDNGIIHHLQPYLTRIRETACL